MSSKPIIISGSTPKGRPFSMRANYVGSTVTSRALEYHPHEGIGAITVPMRAECWYGQLFYELTRRGAVSPETARNCFQT